MVEIAPRRTVAQRVSGRIRGAAWDLRSLTVYAAARSYLPRIRTYTTLPELHALHRLARRCPDDASILEIGAYLGASTCFLAAGVKSRRGHLWCVDTWQNETMPEGIRDTFDEFRRNTRAFAAMITTVRKDSRHLLPGDFPAELDLVFLDGDHSYDATRQDFLTVAERVKPTGTIAFHDAVVDAFPGVARVVGEALSTGNWRIGGLVGNLFWVHRRSSLGSGSSR